MAQHKLVKAANGTALDGIVASSDATSLSGAEMWVIVGASATRETCVRNLNDMLLYVQATKNSFPFA